MGRRFTAASNDVILVDSTGLNGLNFVYGTAAVCFWRQSATGHFETLFDTGTFGFNINASGALNYFDGANDRTFGDTITTGKPWIAVLTKATGTVTSRGHVYDFTTGTWAHSAAASEMASAALSDARVTERS